MVWQLLTNQSAKEGLTIIDTFTVLNLDIIAEGEHIHKMFHHFMKSQFASVVWSWEGWVRSSCMIPLTIHESFISKVEAKLHEKYSTGFRQDYKRSFSVSSSTMHDDICKQTPQTLPCTLCTTIKDSTTSTRHQHHHKKMYHQHGNTSKKKSDTAFEREQKFLTSSCTPSGTGEIGGIGSPCACKSSREGV